MDHSSADGTAGRPMLTGEEVLARLSALSDSCWALAAVGVAVRTGLLDGDRVIPTDDPLVDVLVALDLVVEAEDGRGRMMVPGLRRLLDSTGPASQSQQMVASVRQVLQLLTDDEAVGWAGQDDECLLAQGRASMGLVGPLVEFVLPDLDGLEERLRRPGACFLDVGVGVGGLATAMCEEFPELSVVGLDVLPDVLDLARTQLAERALADRIELRALDVAELDDVDAYDLSWLPTPFVPDASVWAALPRLERAMRPGGWVLVPMNRVEGGALSAALTAWRTRLSGGAVMAPDRLMAGLVEAGFTDVRQLDTPPNAPVLVVARRPGPERPGQSGGRGPWMQTGSR